MRAMRKHGGACIFANQEVTDDESEYERCICVNKIPPLPRKKKEGRLMLSDRISAWAAAQALVQPIVEQHGLEDVRSPAPAFSTPGISRTKVDQHLDHIREVADWLLSDD